MKFFQKKTQNQDQFKRRTHQLSEMSDSELNKVERLLDVVFDPNHIYYGYLGETKIQLGNKLHLLKIR